MLREEILDKKERDDDNMLENIKNVEERISYKFPDDYRDYILSMGSLKPENNLFRTSKGIEKVLRCLFSYDVNDKNYIMKFQSFDSQFCNNVVPFALLEFGDLLCFDRDNNSVVVYNHELDNIDMLSNNFTDFLNMLYNEKKYNISDGGEYNLFCKYDKSIDLEKIKKDFSEHNITVEYEINDDDMWINLYDSTDEKIGVMSEKYDYDDEYQNEMIEDYIEDFGNDDEIIGLMKKINSNYYFKAHSYRESVFVYILAYLLSLQIDVLLYDCYNGCYLDKNKLKSILDEKN